MIHYDLICEDGHEFDGFVDGITGDPQLATAETGEKSYALIAEWIASVVRFDCRPKLQST